MYLYRYIYVARSYLNIRTFRFRLRLLTGAKPEFPTAQTVLGAAVGRRRSQSRPRSRARWEAERRGLFALGRPYPSRCAQRVPAATRYTDEYNVFMYVCIYTCIYSYIYSV